MGGLVAVSAVRFRVLAPDRHRKVLHPPRPTELEVSIEA